MSAQRLDGRQRSKDDGGDDDGYLREHVNATADFGPLSKLDIDLVIVGEKDETLGPVCGQLSKKTNLTNRTLPRFSLQKLGSVKHGRKRCNKLPQNVQRAVGDGPVCALLFFQLARACVWESKWLNQENRGHYCLENRNLLANEVGGDDSGSPQGPGLGSSESSR